MLWKCSFYEYLHEGSDAPEKCPKCGNFREQSSSLFKEEQEEY